MFKKSRRKIVGAIMSVLVLLWVGTLGVIYTSSYFEMKRQNTQMLQTHAQMYALTQSFQEMTPPGKPLPGGNHGFGPGFDPESPKFRLSTFYTVAISYEGETLEIKNDPPTVHTSEELEVLAKRIVKDGKQSGTEKNLTFVKADKDGYILVCFMDNTVVNESAMTLLWYTLIFGIIALVLFFFLSVFLAKKIVEPLEEGYQKQKQFVSDAGHELKTPVSVVSANAELLSREIGENQWLANIQYENERMGMLVGQLLDLAKTENVTPKTERVDFSRLVSGEVLPFESVAFEKGMELRSDIASAVTVDGSSTQLKQLISILLDNAIRHSKDAAEVSLTLTREHSAAVLSVINKGDEIPPQHAQQIFERFYRLDTARSGEDKHYGLGLAIAKTIVNAHHGHIEVLCYNGLVEFRVKLPVAREK
jgi:signal transduction histidine kinase